jgi:serine/threonine protein phosphatase PrpC
MSTPAVEERRRRLTVSHGSPILGDAEEGGDEAQGDRAASDRLQQAGLQSIFSEEELQDKAAFSVTSVTDDNLTRSFVEKATEMLIPLHLENAAAEELRKKLNVSWSCKKGKKPEAANQDSFSVLAVEDEFALYGVYDGHGPKGHLVSNFARELLVKLFIADADRSSDPGAAFKRAFQETQRSIAKNRAELGALTSGSTCTMVYHDMKAKTLTVAHVGDSRCVIGKRSRSDSSATYQSRDLTVDHKPNLPQERERIENSDPPGRVVWDGYFNYRLFAMDGMYPGLNMSRALGDVTAHEKAGLSAMPDIAIVNLEEEHAGDNIVTCLLCSDGVWEFIETKDAFELASKFATEKTGDAVAKLTGMSYDRWMEDSENEISDDITAIVVNILPS